MYIYVAAARQSHYSHLLNSISYIGAERVKKFLFNMQKVIDFNDVSSTYTYYIIVNLKLFSNKHVNGLYPQIITTYNLCTEF